MSVASSECWIQGEPIPADILGELRETILTDEMLADGASELADRLQHDGYLFVRGAIPAEQVWLAREEVFERLHSVGEIHSPAIEGIATGQSLRKERVSDLGEFWRSVSQGPHLRTVSHGDCIQRLMNAVYGDQARAHDYMFLRPGVVGRATRLHYDLPFFARGSQRVLTVWTALGPIPVSEGSLVVVENSHRFDDLIEPIRQIDYDSQSSPQVQMMEDACQFARSRKVRLLTADFAPGDLVVFTMTTLHGTLDNHSTRQRTRLSCDVRWQPAADPVDPRYVGDSPGGTTGAGYGELNGAKPLTEDWHTR